TRTWSSSSPSSCDAPRPTPPSQRRAAKEAAQARDLALVERDGGLGDPGLAPDAETDVALRAQVARDAKRLAAVAVADGKAAEELDDLQPLRRGAPRTESER